MRIGLLIKDVEYRKALAERISDYDSDILLDVISDSEPIEKDALILTDAKPAELGDDLTVRIKDRTVFLVTGDNHHSLCNLHHVFKYTGVSRLLAELSDVHSLWQGMKSFKTASSRLIACCSDSDAFSCRCSALASQIIYTQGGSVLILPLGYINDDTADYGRDINRFARLMYMVKSGRNIDALSISYTDSYGISRLMLPKGRNPVAYLGGEDLESLILYMSNIFDTVILDIAGCYREENLRVLKKVDNLLFFETGKRRISPAGLLDEEDQERLRIIKPDEGSDEVFAMDEYVKEIYGIRDVR